MEAPSNPLEHINLSQDNCTGAAYEVAESCLSWYKNAFRHKLAFLTESFTKEAMLETHKQFRKIALDYFKQAKLSNFVHRNIEDARKGLKIVSHYLKILAVII
jgi:hypothetical protein